MSVSGLSLSKATTTHMSSLERLILPSGNLLLDLSDLADDILHNLLLHRGCCLGVRRDQAFVDHFLDVPLNERSDSR